MSDNKFVLYVRKFLKNPLLGRKQAVSVLASLTFLSSKLKSFTPRWAASPRPRSRKSLPNS